MQLEKLGLQCTMSQPYSQLIVQSSQIIIVYIYSISPGLKYPNLRQTACASSLVHSESVIVPHVPEKQISTRPSHGYDPSIRRISPSVYSAPRDNNNYYVGNYVQKPMPFCQMRLKAIPCAIIMLIQLRVMLQLEEWYKHWEEHC